MTLKLSAASLVPVVILAACVHNPPLVLDDAARAVHVVNSTQEIALRIARTCAPVGVVSGKTEPYLRRHAVEQHANVVEVLYDKTQHAVLHKCPDDFDPRVSDLPNPSPQPS
ncbi:hypothetical protein [Paraliomyxa miuraensis]|uniref:hypothetical protein n=1 Tax=Paraliomyxa miuraensis TaxID=376150 RepID=UPI002254DCC2|nr:hypothetical protein [Paraliomyxa miuraensis]MCX4239417.1 hypothetical protein [Paraliomyxa miuraensis]